MAQKTKLMFHVENHFRQPLERLLPEMLNEHGLTITAARLGISKATIGYWILKLGITVQRVVLLPGETFEIKRPL